MNGLPYLQEIRSVPNFGLSVVNVYFDDGTDIYFARQLVNERLQLATVVIGGLVSSTMLTLLVVPALYKWFATVPEHGTSLMQRHTAGETAPR